MTDYGSAGPFIEEVPIAVSAHSFFKGLCIGIKKAIEIMY